MGSLMGLRSEKTLGCRSELSGNEQLREMPLPRSRYLANECFQVQQGKQAAQEKQKICITPAFAGALAHPILSMFREQWPFLMLPALNIPWLGTTEVFLSMSVSVIVLSGEGASQKGLWYCSPTPVHSKHSFRTDSDFTESTRFSTCRMNVKKTDLKPGLENGLVGLLVGEQAGRSRVDGWEASKQESRSLGTRWNPGSNPMLRTAHWETSGRSPDLPVLMNRSVILFTSWKPDAASGKSWLRQNSLTPIYKACASFSQQCWSNHQSQQIKLKWSLEISLTWIFFLISSLLHIILIGFEREKYGLNYCFNVDQNSKEQTNSSSSRENLTPWL